MAYPNAPAPLAQKIAVTRGLVMLFAVDELELPDGAAVYNLGDSSSTLAMSSASRAASPTFHLNQLNGLPVITFDGVNDRMPVTRSHILYFNVDVQWTFSAL